MSAPSGTTDPTDRFDIEVVLARFNACYKSDGELLLSEYINAYTELLKFFKLLGRLFAFIANDIDSKLRILTHHLNAEYGSNYVTIQKMFEYETTNNLCRKTVSGQPSGTRTMLRLHRALDFISKFMLRLKEEPNDAKCAYVAQEVYSTTLALFHPWLVQKAAKLAMYTLPTRGELVSRMCKQEVDQMQPLLQDTVDAIRRVYTLCQAMYETHSLLDLQ